MTHGHAIEQPPTMTSATTHPPFARHPHRSKAQQASISSGIAQHALPQHERCSLPGEQGVRSHRSRARSRRRVTAMACKACCRVLLPVLRGSPTLAMGSDQLQFRTCVCLPCLMTQMCCAHVQVPGLCADIETVRRLDMIPCVA